MTRDLCTLIYLLNLELREECSRTLGGAWAGIGAKRTHVIGRAAVEADAIGEQQLKWTQSGSSSRSGRDREQQLEAEANGDSVEADAAIGPGSSS